MNYIILNLTRFLFLMDFSVMHATFNFVIENVPGNPNKEKLNQENINITADFFFIISENNITKLVVFVVLTSNVCTSVQSDVVLVYKKCMLLRKLVLNIYQMGNNNAQRNEFTLNIIF